MPRPKPNMTSIQLILSVEAKQALEIMTKRGEMPSVNELVRQLLSNYCAQNEVDVDFSITQWGGGYQRPVNAAILKSQQADESLTPVDLQIVNERLQITLTDERMIAHPLG